MDELRREQGLGGTDAMTRPMIRHGRKHTTAAPENALGAGMRHLSPERLKGLKRLKVLCDVRGSYRSRTKAALTAVTSGLCDLCQA